MYDIISRVSTGHLFVGQLSTRLYQIKLGVFSKPLVKMAALRFVRSVSAITPELV